MRHPKLRRLSRPTQVSLFDLNPVRVATDCRLSSGEEANSLEKAPKANGSRQVEESPTRLANGNFECNHSCSAQTLIAARGLRTVY